MNSYCEPFDDGLKKIKHFKRYPEMLPHVGVHYAKRHPGLLLIAESNYLPDDSTVHMSANGWYSGKSARLSKEEREWIHCRDIIGSGCNQTWPSRGHKIYNNIETALIDAGTPWCENMFSTVAFMNCFQRPGQKGESLKIEPLDRDVSIQVIRETICIIRPKMVCFTSSLAWDAVGRHLLDASEGKIIFEHTPHPGCFWWYRQSKRGIGRTIFIDFAKRWLADGTL
ncbi:MAG: hypothetical protein ACP5I8_14460 [Phycisphaerae bacterium]